MNLLFVAYYIQFDFNIYLVFYYNYPQLFLEYKTPKYIICRLTFIKEIGHYTPLFLFIIWWLSTSCNYEAYI